MKAKQGKTKPKNFFDKVGVNDFFNRVQAINFTIEPARYYLQWRCPVCKDERYEEDVEHKDLLLAIFKALAEDWTCTSCILEGEE